MSQALNFDRSTLVDASSRQLRKRPSEQINQEAGPRPSKLGRVALRVLTPRLYLSRAWWQRRMPSLLQDEEFPGICLGHEDRQASRKLCQRILRVIDAGYPALFAPVRRDSHQGVLLLLDAGFDHAEQGPDGYQALHMAARVGAVAVASLLLDRGAAIDARDAKGWTPLHCAARLGRAEMARLLLSRGASPNAACERGRTPLFSAALGANANSALAQEMLERYGALPDAATREGLLSVWLRHELPTHTERLLASLLQRSSFPEEAHQSAYQLNTLSQAWSVNGEATLKAKDDSLPSLKFDLEGHSAQGLAKTLSPLLRQFHQLYPNLLEPNMALSLIAMCEQLSQWNSGGLEASQERIRQGLPTCLPLGFTGHETPALVWGPYLAYCDRVSPLAGVGLDSVHLCVKGSDGSWSVKDLQELTRARWRPAAKSKEIFASKLKELRYYRPQNFESTSAITEYLDKQVIGNCAWVNMESIIFSLLFIKVASQQPEQSHEAHIAQIAPGYESLLAFLRQRLLEDYLFASHEAYEIDYETLSNALGQERWGILHQGIDERIKKRFASVLKQFLRIYRSEVPTRMRRITERMLKSGLPE